MKIRVVTAVKSEKKKLSKMKEEILISEKVREGQGAMV